MFACNVAVRLKPNSMGEFTRVFENDVLSILQKQTGFQDEITFSTSPSGIECSRDQFVGHEGTRGSIQRHGLCRSA